MAEVNPGFPTSCNDVGCLSALKTKTNVITKSGGDFIKGTIDQNLLSEKLKFLPDEQEELKIEDGHFYDETNPVYLKFPASSIEYVAIINILKIDDSGITQMKYNEGCIIITCNKRRVSELQEKVSSELSKVRSSHWDEIYLSQGEEIRTSELSQNDLVMVFYVTEEMKVVLFSSNKEQLDLVKHKIMVQLGRRALTDRNRKRCSLKTSVESDSSLLYSPDSKTMPLKNTFLTEKGVIIKVYSIPITDTNVECIVNATDTQLRNSFGVSKAIADAAGKGFKAACDEHIRLHGPLKRADAIVLPPGSLKCQCIISIAGPTKFKQDEMYISLVDLENIIVESLKVADGRGLKSIAFPSVCAGLAGLDAELCAQQYYRSVNRFVQQTKSPLNLKEIHFVDVKSSMTKIIQETFTKHYSPQTINFTSTNIKESRLFPASVLPLEKNAAGHTQSSSIPNTDGMTPSEREVKDGDGMLYYPHEKTTIKLVSDNICDIVTDALVSIEDANGSGNGQIAKALLAAAGSRYQDVEHSKVKMAKRSITEVVVTGSGRLKCEFVLHAIAPEWGIKTTREIQSFKNNVEKTMMNIMDAACEKNLKCIAVPLIGIFTDGMSEAPLTICCEAMIAGLDMWIQSHSKEYQFKEVILICSNPVASKCFAYILSAKRKQDIKGGISTRGISLTSSESRSDASIISSSSIQSKENCVICKESITDPKVLPKCGHTFCKECINQQFLYKPACHCCGVVYGKITGSQPNGTMQVFYEKYSLPGFEGCSTIVILYEFAGGIQKAEHPHPGRPYNGTKCKAYLPDNKKGKLVLRLLREAFNRRLVFTIETSRTTGLEDTVTWNDIHHKTNRDGGPQK
ncbi:hypothetical protein ACJMK2_006862 [Sinanodonta woodiana]|uniref:E3 ubiquitin-protein ligase n=1 Tax=Sinanodonta woodiana TaxID=1069815 RepID=A0ABD3VUH0_SINWO